MKKFTMRKAVVDDARQISGLLEELGYSMTPELLQNKIANLAMNTSDIVLVAEADNILIAMAHMHIMEFLFEPGRHGRIMAMVVKNKYRRLGIGRELLIALETSARQRGCVRIELTSGIHREDAHTFYEAQGYSEKRKRFVKVL